MAKEYTPASRNREAFAAMTDTPGNVPPQAVELEEAVLGALMLEKDSIITVQEFITPEAFYTEEHRTIYRAIEELSTELKPIDLYTVTERLKVRKELQKVGGASYLAQLTQKVGSAANVEFHAKIIAQKYVQRELIRSATEIQRRSYDESTDVTELIGYAESEIFKVAEGHVKRSVQSSKDLLAKALMQIEEASKNTSAFNGVPSGFMAIDRVTRLFGADHANVQPHSGAQANLAVYFALLNVGDTVMGMDLSQGGHLTHGSPVNMSGKNYNFVSYGVSAEDGRIDYAALAKQVAKVRPKLLVAGASAYPRAIDFEKLAEIAHGYGAMLMVDMAHIAGLVAGGQHQSPVPYADVVTTTTHKTLRGPRGGLILTNNEYIIKRINSAIFPGTQGGPLEHVIAAKAVCFGEALKPEFKEYARKIVENAKALEAELTARGVKLVSGGTDNHLLLIDLTDEDCTGKELEHNLDEVHITANKNTVPGEKRSPFVTSGVRIGTPAVTTRGMGPDEMKVIADCIADCVFDFANKKDEVASKVEELTKKFPLYE